MDMMTYAMAKAYVDGKGFVELEEDIIIPETTVSKEDDSFNVACPQALENRRYNVYVNGTKYLVDYDHWYEDEGIYISFGTDRLIINYDADEITVEVTASVVPERYIPDSLKVKTIDLDKYGISDVILGLFASNGGQQQLANMDQFFADISTAQVPRLVMTGMGFRFVIDQCTRAFADERAVQIAFAVTAVYNGSVFTLNVSVLSPGGGSALVCVTVT